MSVWLSRLEASDRPWWTLSFLIERASRLPTSDEHALKPLYTMIGSAAIA